MTNRIPNLLPLVAAAAALLSPTALLAQSEGESPYSSAQVDDAAQTELWYQSPILLIGLVLFGAVIIYLIARGRKA